MGVIYSANRTFFSANSSSSDCCSFRSYERSLTAPLPWGNRRSRFACRRKATGSCSCKRTKFERASFARVIDKVASFVEEWGWGRVALFRRICYPPAWSMRIYYPINDEEPTPALPKGGSLNEAQYSLTSNRLTHNRRHPPSLGEGLGVGITSTTRWGAARTLP